MYPLYVWFAEVFLGTLGGEDLQRIGSGRIVMVGDELIFCQLGPRNKLTLRLTLASKASNRLEKWWLGRLEQ